MKWNGKTIIFSINIILIVAAVIIIITSPISRLTDDQQQLQQELAANAELLEQQHQQLTDPSEPSIQPSPSSDLVSPLPSESVQPTNQTMVEPTVESTLPPSEPTPATSNEPIDEQMDNAPPEVTAIGDSVMLGTVNAMQSLFPSIYIDAATSRQAWDADEIITSLKDSNLLGNKVIIALGANGTFSKEVGQELLDLIDLTTHTVYWVLPYGDAIPYQADVVEKVYQLQYDNPSLVVIDWPLMGYDHPEWFYDDNTHLNADGQQGYAQYLYDCIYGG